MSHLVLALLTNPIVIRLVATVASTICLVDIIFARVVETIDSGSLSHFEKGEN